MRINHNIAALNTLRELGINHAAADKSLQKLSSGMRINSAADDAAGLAISEKMRGQINGLNQATTNAQDGISMIQTAEGSLNETHSILQRMRELAVQSASDTNTDSDRQNIQDEVDQLTSEIDRIRNTTQYNTKNLLDGSLAAKTGAVANVLTSAVLDASGATSGATTTSVLVALQDDNGNSLGIVSGDTITVSFVSSGTTHIGTAFNVTSTTAVSNLVTSGGASGIFTLNNASATSGDLGAFTITAAASGFSNAIHGLVITVKDSDGVINAAASDALSSFTQTTAAKDNVSNDGTLTFQIGANADQSIGLALNDMGATALGLKDLKVDTQESANVAIKVIDEATATVSTERSKLGAVQNRLEHTINNLGTASQNLTASESQIRDVDMAAEMMNYTKENILTQAAQAMLAQANQEPQGVLQLLR